MIVSISSELHGELLGWAAAGGRDEVCGLLFGRADRIEAAQLAVNVAADPRTRFEVDPAMLIAAHVAARNGGPPLIGCFHSHPEGPPEPSAADCAQAFEPGWLWLILGEGRARLWRAAGEGQPFTAVSLAVIPRC